MDSIEVATIGANIENDFDYYTRLEGGGSTELTFNVPVKQGDKTVMVSKTHQLRVIDTMDFSTGTKAIALEDEDGNVYVHFRGTGDKEWGYNATNYGGDPSDVQKKSLEFFDRVVKEQYEGKGKGKLYLTGHSQGGNTAQYVTINTEYGDYIDTCVTLDGPGPSESAVESAKDRYGEAYYERQRQKIHGVYGESDYVSPLGQKQIVPEDQITFVDNTGGDYHVVSGMMDGTSLNKIVEDDTPLRKLVVGLNEKILREVDPEDQRRGAELAMMLIETINKGYQPGMTQQDFDDLKELVLPLVVDYLHEHPEMIDPVLNQLVDEGKLDRDTANIISGVIKGFNLLPKELRHDIVNTLGEFFVLTEDGTIDLRGDIKAVINGVTSVVDFVAGNPIVLAALVIGMVMFLPFVVSVAAGIITFVANLSALVIGLYAAAELIENLGKKFNEFIHNTLNAVQKKIQEIAEFVRKNSPGGKYASNNPYFKADPATMRSYASRLSRVNTRLRNLDWNLNDLYWQVGILDILDILDANIITSYSLRVVSAKNFLNSAADILENAENKALGYMGG